MTATPPEGHVRGFRALLTPAQWSDLIASGREAAFKRGTSILDQGDRKGAVYVLRRGRVRVVYTEPDGNQVLIAIRGPGDLLGEYAQRDLGAHVASVWTIEACETTAVASDPFDRYLERHHLEPLLQHYILTKTRQGAQRLWRASNLHTEQRLAQLFIEVANADPEGASDIVPMSQTLIADSLGVTRRTVSPILNQWRRHGLVQMQPSRITVLDSAALARRATLR